MPDLDPLPHRPRMPSFAPRPDDYAVVVGRARNRRRKQAGAAGAGLAGVATVVALTVGGGGGSFGLKQMEPTNGGASATASAPAAASESPAPRPSESAGSEEEAAPAEPRQQPGAEPSEPPDGEPDRGGVEPPYEGEPPREPASRPPLARPVVALDEVADTPAAPCESDPSVLSATGWCLRFDGPATVRVGEAEPFRVFACRRLGRDSGELTFQTEQHVELVAEGGDNQREEWRWSAGYPFPERANTVTVPEQRCARWTVTWDAEGSDGDYVRPGPYTMTMSIMTGDYGDDTGGAVAVSSWHEFDVTE